MKEKIFLFIKGIILGISFVIPGVSGGTLAVLMGIYEELIEAASNFYKSVSDFKKYFIARFIYEKIFACDLKLQIFAPVAGA